MKKVFPFWIAAVLALFAGPALSQNIGPYVGIGIGATKGDLDRERIDAALASGGVNVASRTDDNDTSYRAMLGYRYDQWFALEVAYVNFGEYKYTAGFGGSNRTFSSEAWAAGINGLLFYPVIPGLEAFAKAGLHFTEVKADAITVGGVTARAAETANGFSPSIGAGLSSDIRSYLTIRFEYDRYFNVGNANTTGEQHINAAAVSAILRF